MARSSSLIHSFSAGEVSIAGALARIDQQKLKLAAETQENIFGHVIGKGMMRPGTTYLGASASNNQARGIAFVRSLTQKALLELTDAKLRVWVDDALVTRASVTSTVGDSGFDSDNTDLADAATKTSSTLASGTLAQLVDGDTTTGAVWDGSATGTLTLDFTTAKTIRQFWLTASGTPSRAPNAFTLKVSATGAFAGEETTVYTATGLANWGSREQRQFEVTTPTSARYIRLSMTSSEAGAASYQLSEVSAFDTVWLITTTGGATGTIASSTLTLAAPSRGGTVNARQLVTTSSASTQHALRIDVARGPVTFEVGSTDGGDEYITRTTLETGLHSLAFTPTGSYYIRFSSELERQVKVNSCAIESAGVMEITAPWSTSQLRNIQFTQSLDVMWLAHSSWQTRKVERRGDASWSLVHHKTRDGPFVAQSPFDAKVKLTPGQAYGNTTLAASRAAFKSTDVGSLIRAGAQGFDQTYSLGAVGAATEAVRLTGIGAENTYSWVVAGTFVGTWRIQISYDGPDTGWLNTATSGTSTASSSTDPAATYDNVIFWVRIAVEAYTSGVISARIFSGSTAVGSGGDGGSRDASGGGAAGGEDGIYRITAFNSSTSVDVEVLKNPSALTATSDWQRSEFSDRRGWSAAVGLHDGRLALGRDDRPPLSVSDDYDSFNVSTSDLGDAASIQKNLATSSSANKIVAFLALQRLIALTDGAEVPARSSAFDSPLTPAASSFKDASDIGAAAYSPAKFGKRGLYISRSGMRLYQLYYNFEAQDYDSDDLNEFNDEIGTDAGFVELAVQRHPEPYIWVVKGDGEVAVLLFSPKHGITGWQRFITTSGDEVESVAVLPQSAGQDRVYLFVKRTVNSSTVRYLEKVALHTEAIGAATTKLWDSGVFYSSVSGTTATGLSHLEGETVGAWGNGKVLSSSLTVSGGQVTLPASGATNVFIGLPYTGRYKSSKLAYGVEGGSALLEPKIVSEVGLLAAYVHKDAIKVGPSFSALTSYTIRQNSGSAVSDSAPVKTTHDDRSQAFGGTWDTDSRVHLTIQPGHPATLLGLVVKLKGNQK